MSPSASLAMTFGIVAADTALVLACRFVAREPFMTIDRRLAAAWSAIYRATGAAALDRAINRRRDARDVDTFAGLAETLGAAGMTGPAARCRDTAARIRTRST